MPESLITKYKSFWSCPTSLQFAYQNEYLNARLSNIGVIHFKAEEFTKSSVNPNNVMTKDFDALMSASVVTLCHLDKLRDRFGKPIYINSGYRNPITNSRVRGAKNSRHMRCLAADIRPADLMDLNRLWDLLHSPEFEPFVHECIMHDTYIHVGF